MTPLDIVMRLAVAVNADAVAVSYTAKALIQDDCHVYSSVRVVCVGQEGIPAKRCASDLFLPPANTQDDWKMVLQIDPGDVVWFAACGFRGHVDPIYIHARGGDADDTYIPIPPLRNVDYELEQEICKIYFTSQKEGVNDFLLRRRPRRRLWWDDLPIDKPWREK